MRLLVTFSFFFQILVTVAEEPSGHLFILSGQSNMTGDVKKGFASTVEAMIGKKPDLVFHSKPGRGIRFWVKEYQLPKDHPMADLSKNKSNGEEFPKLVELVKKSYDPTKFKTVHLIWMQGESDANRDLGVAYEASFKTLLENLEKELGIKKLHFVIGRISDFGLHGDAKTKVAWTRMRKAQEKLATDNPQGKWIDTDQFIPAEEKTKKGNLHYPKEEAVKLGARFGQAVLIQIAEGS